MKIGDTAPETAARAQDAINTTIPFGEWVDGPSPPPLFGALHSAAMMALRSCHTLHDWNRWAARFGMPDLFRSGLLNRQRMNKARARLRAKRRHKQAHRVRRSRGR